jgi:hypothetical protein
MPGHRKEPPEVPAFSFSGGWKEKSERGREKGDASPDVRWKQTWEAPKLKRAEATPFVDKKTGGAEGTAGLVGGNRWSADAKPDGLVRKRTSGWFRGNLGPATEPDESPEERSP